MILSRTYPDNPARCGIEDFEIVKKILQHPGLWEIKQRPAPKATGPPKPPEYSIDYSVSQVSGLDNWLYVDRQYPETYAA